MVLLLHAFEERVQTALACVKPLAFGATMREAARAVAARTETTRFAEAGKQV